mgnify:CR=1 FL=1
MRGLVALALACGALTAGLGAVRAQGPALEAKVVVPQGAEEVWDLEGKRRAAAGVEREIKRRKLELVTRARAANRARAQP